jgi:hypothetical protein
MAVQSIVLTVRPAIGGGPQALRDQMQTVYETAGSRSQPDTGVSGFIS